MGEAYQQLTVYASGGWDGQIPARINSARYFTTIRAPNPRSGVQAPWAR